LSRRHIEENKKSIGDRSVTEKKEKKRRVSWCCWEFDNKEQRNNANERRELKRVQKRRLEFLRDKSQKKTRGRE
jgi:hypothetical protein